MFFVIPNTHAGCGRERDLTIRVHCRRSREAEWLLRALRFRRSQTASFAAADV